MVLWLAAACTEPPRDGVPEPAPVDPDVTGPPGTATGEGEEPGAPPLDLEVLFLGVGGYLVRYGSDAVMTPPLYTNPDFLETTFGTVASEPALVAEFGAGVPFGDVKAILVGHAHYDHLMDAPTIWPYTDDAVFYGNATMRHILAAYAPDRDPSCTSEPQEVQIPRDRVVQLDDPMGELGRDLVDYRMCPELDPGFGDGEGEWVAVEGTNVRFRAVCSIHPDQVGPIHFAPGALDEDLCSPPRHADDWLEGRTLAYLVDFLDEDGVPVHRVYYQDAPTNPPIGLFHPDLLEEKAVDVALLNVGNYDAVANHPGATLELLLPRYTIGGHWEDFFRTQDQPLMPILFHDIGEYARRAAAEMAGEELPVEVDGEPSEERQWVPDPGTLFLFPPEVP